MSTSTLSPDPQRVVMPTLTRSSGSGHANLNSILGSQRVVAIALTLSLLIEVRSERLVYLTGICFSGRGFFSTCPKRGVWDTENWARRELVLCILNQGKVGLNY